MSQNSYLLIGTLLGSSVFGSVLTVMVQSLASRGKNKAEAEKTLGDGYSLFVDRLQKQIDAQQTQFILLERKYTIVKENYDRIDDKYDRLKRKYDELNTQYETLQDNYIKLKDENTALKTRVFDLESELSKTNLLVHA